MKAVFNALWLATAGLSCLAGISTACRAESRSCVISARVLSVARTESSVKLRIRTLSANECFARGTLLEIGLSPKPQENLGIRVGSRIRVEYDTIEVFDSAAQSMHHEDRWSLKK